MTGNYDIETKSIYWGTGNAAPWPGATHPGDNLYSSSVLALDPQNGQGESATAMEIPPLKLRWLPTALAGQRMFPTCRV